MAQTFNQHILGTISRNPGVVTSVWVVDRQVVRFSAAVDQLTRAMVTRINRRETRKVAQRIVTTQRRQ